LYGKISPEACGSGLIFIATVSVDFVAEKNKMMARQIG